MTTDDKLAVSQEAEECANRCIPPAVIFAEDERHVADLRRRAGEHIARFEAQVRIAGERAGMERAAGIADEAEAEATEKMHGSQRDKIRFAYATAAVSARSIAAAILKEAASITPEGDV